MKFIRQKINDVIIIEPSVYEDSRGFFLETYNKEVFKENGIDAEFVQDNMSSSRYGTLRGLHYQLEPHAQGKLIRVIEGEVFDVAVDIRKDSPTFNQWVGAYINEENKKSMFIPEGLAHAFLVLSEKALFQYKCTNFYYPESARAIIWNDKDLNIDWPINPMIISDKDKKANSFKQAIKEIK